MTADPRPAPPKMTEAEFNLALKRLGVFGACSFNPRAKRSMFGKIHLIRDKERTAYCNVPRPRGSIDKVDHVPLYDEWRLCEKCRTAFETFAQEGK